MLAKRFEENPIIKPEDVKPSREDFVVECVFNPGAFTFQGMTGLLCRVAEKPLQKEGSLSVPVINFSPDRKVEIFEFSFKDPDLDYDDPRKFTYKKKGYLTTLSHLRLAWSRDGIHFTLNEKPTIEGNSEYETFGVEDCRVCEILNTFYLTYTAVSENGVGVGLISTGNWEDFERHGLIFPPHNKDCTLFPKKINDEFYAFHRPGGIFLGGNYIWMSSSPDLVHWGKHICVAHTRDGMWDSERIGVNGPPVKTEDGWLVLYHGVNKEIGYCIGAMLCDLNSPAKIIKRSKEPIMEPTAEYEKTGFFNNVVFSNGHTVNGDDLIIYYGAADKVICGAKLSIKEILNSLD